MDNKYYFKALNRTLRDIIWIKTKENHDKPFGRLTMVLNGNFKQILPVVPKGRRSDIIEASITSSYLCPKFKILALKKNIRVTMNKKNRSISKVINYFL